MSTLAAARGSTSRLDAARVQTLLVGWQAALSVAAIAALGLVMGAGVGPTDGLFRIISIVGLGVAAALAATSAALLRRGRHLGRAIALTVNYLGFVIAVVVLLQTTRVFVGLDALAETFARGVPFLAVALIGWLVVGGEDAAPNRAVIGRRIALAGILAALIAVGLLPGLLTFAGRLISPTRLPVLVIALAFGVIAWRVYQPDIARHFNASATQRRTLDGLLFISPNLLGFFAFFAGPLLFSLFVSLNEWDAFGTTNFIGLDNYINILALDFTSAGEGLKGGYQELTRFGDVVIGARDPLFWRSILNILKFSVLAIPLAVVPAVFMAQLLNSKVPGIKVFRALYFIPSIAGVIAVALIWRQLFSSTVGWINYLILQVVNFWNWLPLLPETSDPAIQWLSDADVALYSLVIVFAWQYVGFNTVLFFAGLQGIPGDLYEAAALDGATPWQRFRHITLPSLKPTTFFVVASTGVLALQLFGESVVLFPQTTPAGAGPGNSTLTPVVYLYEQGFRRFSQGYASAVAWVLFALIFSFTFIQFQRQRDETEAS